MDRMLKAFRELRRDPAGVASGAFILMLVFIAVFAPVIFATDPNEISGDVLTPPLELAPLGTDELGRDVLVALAFGVRVSLLVGLATALAATVVGILVGSFAGYYGNRLDTLLMRITEVFQVMPTFILAALIVALAGPGLAQLVGVIAMLSWPQAARVMRGEVLRVKNLEFVDAARCLALGELRVMLGEVVPNAIGPVVAVGTLTVGQAILIEASLSFLGLSSTDVVSWGRMLNSGQQRLFDAWWLSVFPGLAVFVTVLAFNLLGDSLSRVFNPRRSGE